MIRGAQRQDGDQGGVDVLTGGDSASYNHFYGDLDDAFLAAVGKRNISLDYLFLGNGEPFLSEVL